MVNFNTSFKALENYDAKTEAIRFGPNDEIKIEKKPGFWGRLFSRIGTGFIRFFGGDRPAEKTAKKLMEIFENHQTELQNNPKSQAILVKLGGFMLKDSVSQETQRKFTDFIGKFSVAPPQDAVSEKVNAVGSPLGKGGAVVIPVAVEEPVVDEEAKRKAQEHEQKVVEALQTAKQKEDEAKTIAERARSKVEDANEAITSAKEEAASNIHAAEAEAEQKKKEGLAEIDIAARGNRGTIDIEYTAKTADKKKEIDEKCKSELEKELKRLEEQANDGMSAAIARIEGEESAKANSVNRVPKSAVGRQRQDMIEGLKQFTSQRAEDIRYEQRILENTKQSLTNTHQQKMAAKKAEQDKELDAIKRKKIETAKTELAEAESSLKEALQKLDETPNKAKKMVANAELAFAKAVSEAEALNRQAEELAKQ